MNEVMRFSPLSKLENRDETIRKNTQIENKTMNGTPERRSRSLFKNGGKQNSIVRRERNHYPLEGKIAQGRDTSPSPIGLSPIKRHKNDENKLKQASKNRKKYY